MTERIGYQEPAARWFEALPIGNGRIGAMVFSDPSTERLQLAETTAWSGGPSDDDVNPRGPAEVPRIRELLFWGRYEEAQQLANEAMLSKPASFGTNLPLPELRVQLPGEGLADHYFRELPLDDGIVSARFERGGVSHEREVFASHPDRVIAMRIASEALSAGPVVIEFGSAVYPAQHSVDGGTLTLDARAVESLHSDGATGVRLHVRAHPVTDGVVVAGQDRLEIVGATDLVILVAIGTDWGGVDPVADAATVIDAAIAVGWDQLRQRHLDDHRELMHRVRIDLGADGLLDAMPTDLRRERYARGGDDPGLEEIFFQFGRYLTVAGSRGDSPLPLALQGLWNDGLASSASWTNDFHIDMNTQQNYWAAELGALPEAHTPLVGLVERLSRAGRSTARNLYGAPGWVAHTVTNAWGYSAPGSGPGWGLHVTGGAWIALHLWDHYDYGRDVDFLRNHAYPVLRGAAEFFESYLVAEPITDHLLTGPSDSPENWYLGAAGGKVAVSMGNTCDRVFVDAIFRVTAASARILEVDSELADRLDGLRDRLPPFQIGRHGQLQEWLEDFEEAVPSHRHTSHLCALYPEFQIRPRTTPELAEAARVTIRRRQQAAGWEQTEWVEANMINYFARLGDGNEAHEHVRGLIADAAETNLMTFSAGGVAGAAQNIYSFDGNPGGTAGIAEMLVQGDGDEIELLPALASAWPTGSVSGLRLRGGHSVDLAWRGGELESARLSTSVGGSTRVRYRDAVIEVDLVVGEITELDSSRF